MVNATVKLLQSFHIWMRGDQRDPVELIEQSRISFKGFERLASDGANIGDNLLEFVVNRLVENIF